MNDKLWLERVTMALKEYEKQFGEQTQATDFVKWLYRQYGISIPKE